MIKKLHSLLTVKSLLLFIAVTLLISSAIYLSIYEHNLTVKDKRKAEEGRTAALKKAIDDTLAQTINWANLEIKQIGLTDISLKTKYAEGRMYYFLRGAYVSDQNRLPKGDYGDKFIIEFFDKDGFLVYTKDLLLSDKVELHNSGSKTFYGFEYRGDVFLGREVYRSFKDWSLIWQF